MQPSNWHNPKIKSVLVLGGGSAGFLAAITLKTCMPQLPVTVVLSREIGVIGVGESTTPGFMHHLHSYLKIDRADFFRQAEPIWKIGIRFLWGKRPYFDYAFRPQLDVKYSLLPKYTGYYCDEGPFDYVGIPSGLMSNNAVYVREADGSPDLQTVYSYHLENVTFVAYLENLASRMGIVIQEDKVVEVLQNEEGIAGLRLQSEVLATADLYIDCSGFRSLLVSRTLHEPFVSYRSTLFCDRAVWGGWERDEEPIQPYTTAETMNSGWCWGIDHEKCINRGYVYSSEFLDDAGAEAELRAKNPKVGPTKFVKFISGRYERSWVKNVVAIGNSSGFVEPLESTALAALCYQSQSLAETIKDGNGSPTPSLIGQYNKRTARSWDTIRRFLSIHYKFNTRLETPFWKACRADVDLAGAQEFVEYFQENGPSVLWRNTLLEVEDQFGMEGYLSLLVGQQVPYRKTYIATEEEWTIWHNIRQHYFKKTANAFSVAAALQMIRSPNWVWPSS